MLKVITAFGINDLKSIRRDSLLLGVVSIPWFLVLGINLSVSSLTQWLDETHNFNLIPYYPLILSIFFLINVPMLFGALMGFLMIDERDDKTLTALRVTPISMRGYTFYRIFTNYLISFIYIVVCMPLTGLIPLSQLRASIPIALIAALLAPVIGLLLVSFANNKVESLAIAKGFGILVVGPLAAYFLESQWQQWQLLLGLIPTYWVAKTFWLALEGQSYQLYALVGLFYQLLMVGVFLGRFETKLYQ